MLFANFLQKESDYIYSFGLLHNPGIAAYFSDREMKNKDKDASEKLL
jgi:hypothetical protein